MLLFWKVLATALRWRPDIIHGHLHEGALLGLTVRRLLGIPLVFDFQGSMTSEMIDHRFWPGTVFSIVLFTGLRRGSTARHRPSSPARNMLRSCWSSSLAAAQNGCTR